MKWKFFTIVALLLWCVYSLKATEIVLQQHIDSVLRIEMSKSQIDSALVLLMSVKDAGIEVMVKVKSLRGRSYKTYTDMKYFSCKMNPGTLFIPFSIVTSLETGKVKSTDTVDTYNGMYEFDNNQIMRDLSYQHGGYGKILLSDCIVKSSNVGTALSVGKAFQFSTDYLLSLEKFHFINSFDLKNLQQNNIRKNDIAWMSIGYGVKLTPLEILSGYNLFANSGVYVPYNSSENGCQLNNNKICSDYSVDVIQKALLEKGERITELCGLDKENSIAGMLGRTQMTEVGKGTYESRSLCCYFPVNKPEYICLIMKFGQRDFEMSFFSEVLKAIIFGN